jgi:thiamine pyrophosphate-dependent acetolactate synthase large subunit-like protein
MKKGLRMTNRMTVGERIVQNLLAEGVELISSHGELSLMEIQMHALRQGMRMVGARHEAAGVFMAAAYYRLTGRPQVAMGAQGPGAANMLAAAISCREENIPVILIGASRQHESTTGVRTGRFLHSDLVFPAFAGICKWAGKILHPRQVDEMMQQAFRQAMSGTPGPVYVQVDYEGHQQSFPYNPLPLTRYSRLRSSAAPAAQILQAADAIRSARSPLILAGESVQPSRAFDLLRRLAQAIGCPATTPMTARGAVRENEDFYINFSSDTIREVIDETDLVIAIGTTITEHVNYGRQRHWAKGEMTRKWIMIHEDPTAFGVNRPIDIPVCGAIGDVLDQLLSALEQGPARPRNPKLGMWRERFLAERRQRIEAASGLVPMHPYELMARAREAVPDDAIIITECGLTGVYLNDAFEQRSNDYIWNVIFGLMGAGLPHALGAQMAAPDRRVCLVTGDGGLGPHVMDFETAVRHALPVVVIVNDDQSYGAELAALHAKMGSTPEARFHPTRYDQMIEAVGGHGEYVERAEDIAAAVARAFASGKPALVQVRVDQDSGLNHLPFGNAELFSWVHQDANDQRARETA